MTTYYKVVLFGGSEEIKSNFLDLLERQPEVDGVSIWEQNQAEGAIGPLLDFRRVKILTNQEPLFLEVYPSQGLEHRREGNAADAAQWNGLFERIDGVIFLYDDMDLESAEPIRVALEEMATAHVLPELIAVRRANGGQRQFHTHRVVCQIRSGNRRATGHQHFLRECAQLGLMNVEISLIGNGTNLLEPFLYLGHHWPGVGEIQFVAGAIAGPGDDDEESVDEESDEDDNVQD